MNWAHYDPIEFVILSVVYALVVVYWVAYTRRMKTPPNVGKNEGIAIALEHKAHHSRTGAR
jgi:hypothetical protein